MTARWVVVGMIAGSLAAACGEDTVAQANRPPELKVPGPQIVVEGALAQFTVTASDPDDDVVTIEAKDLPEGATFEAESGQFLWAPTTRQAGNYNISFSGSDGRFTVVETVAIAVVNNNRPPIFAELDGATVTEGQVLSMQVNVSDPDEDAVALEALQLPRGAEFNAATGTFTWRPGYDQSGLYSILFIATDDGVPQLSSRLTTTIRVEDYVEEMIAYDFPVRGYLRDGTVSTTLTAGTLVTLDFSDQTEYSPSIREMKISNLPTMADASWQPFEPLVDWLVTPGDGVKTVYARFRDFAENASPRVEGKIELDTTPPFPVSALLLDRSPTNLAVVSLGLAAQDKNGLHETAAVTLSEDAEFAGSDLVGPMPFPLNGVATFPLAEGEGARTIYVRFRDVAGNDARLAVPLVVDRVAPDPGVLTIVSPTHNGFTNSVSVLLTLSAPADAVQIVLAPAANSATCADSDLSGRAPQPVFSTTSFLLPAGDGPKRVCAKLYDAAGNASSFFSATITLDTVPPTAPVITTAPQVVSLADNAAFTVNTAGPVTEANFLRYEKIGGKTTTWASAATSIATTAFSFNVNSVAGATTPNLLRLRAVDMAGNVSPEASVVITTKPTPPAAGTLTIVSPTNNGFTNNRSVTVQLTYPADAVQVAMVAKADTACVDADLAGAAKQPVSTSAVMLLPSPDGAKRVCAKVYDAAGSASPFFFGTITLDTIPPTAPVIVTAGQTVNLADNSPFTVQTAGPVSELNFERYEKLGGQLANWTADSTNINTTSFVFNVVSSSSYPAGRPNLFKLRAVDKAGNTSPEASVIITTDTVPPGAPTAKEVWVDNQDGKATVYWQASPSPDVSHYRVYYGLASGSYTGTYAAEGPSPVNAGAQLNATLSGLINGTVTYAVIRPVDFAGNEGPASAEVRLQPDEISASLVAEVPLSSSFAGVDRMVVAGSYLYVLGRNGYCSYSGTGAAIQSVLQVVHLDGIVSQYLGGTIHTAANAPDAGSTYVFSDSVDCPYPTWFFGQGPSDMVADGPFLFTAAGRTVRVFSILNPATPQVLGTIDLGAGAVATGIQVRGDRLFVASRGAGGVRAYNIASLYDGNAGTRTFTQIGSAATQGNALDSFGLALSHNTLVSTSNGGSGSTWRVDEAIGLRAGTFGDGISDYTGDAGLGASRLRLPVASGPYLYVGNDAGLRVFNLFPAWNQSPVGSVVGSYSLGGAGYGALYNVLGHLAYATEFVGGQGAVTALDLTQVNAIAKRGTYRSGGYASALWGPYLLTAMNQTLRIFEIATPRTLRGIASIGAGTVGRLRVAGAFLRGSGGSVFDLQEGLPPAPAVSRTATCHQTGTWMDDYLIMAPGDGRQLHIYDLFYDQANAVVMSMTERALGPPAPTNTLTTVNLADGSTVTGLDAVGSYLVAAERRSTGTWVEVFDARTIRNRAPGSFSPTAHKVGAFRVSPLIGNAQVFVHHGRALVALADTASDGLYAVDLRPLFDDEAGATPVALGYVPMPAGGMFPLAPRAIWAQGNYVYLASHQGGIGTLNQGALVIVDISPVMQTTPVALTASAPKVALFTSSEVEDVVVHGGYAFTVGMGDVSVVDVSRPLQPRLVRSVGFPGTRSYCTYADGNLLLPAFGIAVAGSRLYSSGWSSMQIFELE